MAGKTRKKVTSTDIARAAGVSQATVSMVLNKKYNVSFSRETVEKVENAAKDLGYILPKRAQRKKQQKQPADSSFLSYSDKSLLCDAPPGD